MTTPDLFTVAGTTFRFPELPPENEIDPGLYARITAERAAILAAAANPKPTPPPFKVKPYPRVKPGNGEFTPKPGAPGDVITVDGRDFEVWSPGPGAGTRWVTHERRFFLLRGTGEHATVSPDPAEALEPGVSVEWYKGYGALRPIISKTDVA